MFNISKFKKIIPHIKSVGDFIVLCEKELTAATDLFFGHGTENARDEAFFLVFSALGYDFYQNKKVNYEKKIKNTEIERILHFLDRRIKNKEPMPYICNSAYFCKMKFHVDKRVLIPRSPIAELICKEFSPWIKYPNEVENIIDIGTGSGCIAVACANYFKNATIYASDISDDALEVAKINVVQHGFEKRIHLIKSDVFKSVPKLKYDIIVANPPYVSHKEYRNLPAEYKHEPRAALLSGKIGLNCIDIILSKYKKFLSKHGILVVDIGNSKKELIKKYPRFPFIWLEFANNLCEVFLLQNNFVWKL